MYYVEALSWAISYSMYTTWSNVCARPIIRPRSRSSADYCVELRSIELFRVSLSAVALQFPLAGAKRCDFFSSMTVPRGTKVRSVKTWLDKAGVGKKKPSCTEP